VNGQARAHHAVSQLVSIRTRQRCRVNGSAAATRETKESFNPHPAALPGEWLLFSTGHHFQVVSIRTRQRCRVNAMVAGFVCAINEFQSAPGSAAG